MKVHYCHGLESGIHGYKVRHLGKHFDVVVPDQHMSLNSLKKRNSVLRHWIRRLPRLSPGKAALASLDACVEIQRAALADRPADLLIGSSWGGWVAAVLLAEGHYQGPAILLCPALSTMAERLPWSRSLRDHPRNEATLTARLARLDTGSVRLVHGTADTVVTLEGSRRLSKAAGIELEEVPGASHGLSDLVRSGRLVELVNEVAAL